ncbi:hypothetical protein Asppvi_007720 [Aspergillus pseudoviridinutans]|uniref:Cytochrome P450 n=1 Tax=Aspergillus pseudoviridinutans TaxID=1517512 RepID=A0A9P3EXA0_9EURO|nr:uncharacterized protein Asppvi_007720 [Aspergillus pseudoviridinutans]GIJ88793.1 hypothetical protein Asppvi_007720 [Aspergillus pseudoviridinutans]
MLESLSLSFSTATTSTAIIVLVLGLYILLIPLHAASKSTTGSIPLYEWDTRALGSPKKRWMWDSISLLREGYQRFYNKPWRVWTTEGYQVVLPPPYIDELKMLPDHTFPSSLREFMQPQYTMRPSPPWKLDYVNHVILHDLNKNMVKVFPAMRAEVTIALSMEFPASDDWSEITLYTQCLRLVCRVAGRAFVGTGLYRNEEWIDIMCNYTKDIFVSALKLRAIPSFLRPLLYRLIPDVQRVFKHNARAGELIGSIVKQREKDEATIPGYTKPNDTIEWIRDLVPNEDKKNYGYQGIAQLAIAAVSVRTTSQLITNILLNLIAYPEYVPILKEEIENVLASCNGQWTLDSMSKLEKLDSFMKESLRFDTPLTATFQRKAVQRITLSDGTVLQPGTLALAPSNAIAFDPNIYPDPDKFDGLRFYKLRHQNDSKANNIMYQFTAASKTQVQFGGGRHACPGRWFAAHLIKMVVAAILFKYDLKFRTGEERPKTWLFQTINTPDPKGKIMVRKAQHV